jgi:Na+-translocating ferredoxin:NAD+ oxidoreductase RnfD subunit
MSNHPPSAKPLSARAALKQFFRKPKGMLILIFAGLLILVAALSPALPFGVGLLGAMLAAAAVDLPILRYRDGKWSFPDGALLTGLIVGMIISPLDPWYVPTVTAVIGVVSKYLLRTRTANIFNPAALALIVSYFIFGSAQSWWGAMPDVSAWALVALIATGVYITDRVNKMPLLLAFLGVYYALFTVASWIGDPEPYVTFYRQPNLHAALFFGFFMLTDPPTSPPRARDQLYFGVITAVVCFGFFQLVGAVYYLSTGLMVANIWEAWRRVRAHSERERLKVHETRHPHPV